MSLNSLLILFLYICGIDYDEVFTFMNYRLGLKYDKTNLRGVHFHTASILRSPICVS